MILEPFELFLTRFLDADHGVGRGVERAQQLVELELDRVRIVVLSVLDHREQQQRQERETDRDRELPPTRESEAAPTTSQAASKALRTSTHCSEQSQVVRWREVRANGRGFRVMRSASWRVVSCMGEPYPSGVERELRQR